MFVTNMTTLHLWCN